MINTRHLRPLIWKECRNLVPLAAAVVVLSLLAILATLMLPMGPSSRESMFYAWFLLPPNLLAFGIPALQIGHEEETGTLNWQRSLPISWSTTMLSKVIAALYVMTAGWAVAAASLAAALATANAVPGTDFTRDVGAGVFQSVGFTLMLLGSSYVCAWWFRSATAGLLAVVPLVTLATALSLWGGYLLEGLVQGRYPNVAAGTGYVGVAQWVLAGFLISLAFRAARRRWTRPDSAHTTTVWAPRRMRGTTAESASPYRPAVAMSTRPPGLRRALIWQSVMQARAVYLSVFALLLFSAVAWATTDRPDRYIHWFVMATVGSAVVLGTAAFVGDAARQRYRFLAERGLPRWTVWWTRLAVPVVALALVISVGSLVIPPARPTPNPIPWHFAALLTSFVLVPAFAFGQLSAMWARRTVVAYFSGITLAAAASAMGAIVYQLYPEYTWTAVLGVIALVVATLRMTRRWSQGDRSAGYHGRMIGWIGIAALAVVAPIAAHRYWTTPAAMPEWRQEMFAAAESIQTPTTQLRPTRYLSLSLYRPRGEWLLRDPEWDQLNEAFEEIENGGETLYTAHHLPWIINQILPQLRRDATPEGSSTDRERYVGLMRLAVHNVESFESAHPWDRVRQASQVDQLEWVVAQELSHPESRQLLGEALWNELAGALRTPQQRREDRRLALIRGWAWASDQAPEWGEGIPLDHWSLRLNALSAERARSWRYFDLATRISLEQLESGLPRVGSPGEQARLEAWARTANTPDLPEADPNTIPTSGAVPTLYWNREFDEAIERVRNRATP